MHESYISYIQPSREGGWFFFIWTCLFKNILFFVNWILLYFLYFIKYYYIMFIIIVFWLARDRPLALLFYCTHFTTFHSHTSLLTFSLCFFVLFRFCYSHGWVFGKTFMHEFPFPIAILNSTFFFVKWDDWNGWRVASQKLP